MIYLLIWSTESAIEHQLYLFQVISYIIAKKKGQVSII
jgi:hypothetical protein